jgi:hypothetical protein
MPFVCKVLVLEDNAEALKMIAEAFVHPRYELEFAHDLDEAISQVLLKWTDILVVDSEFIGESKMEPILKTIPTVIVERESVSLRDNQIEEFDRSMEIEKVKTAAKVLLRKNHINWMIEELGSSTEDSSQKKYAQFPDV